MYTDEDIEEIEARYDEREERLRRLLGEIADLFNEVHRSYPSTAVCWGGIGGAAVTHHCSWECDNHVAHRETNGRLRTLLGEARRLSQGGAL